MVYHLFIGSYILDAVLSAYKHNLIQSPNNLR